MNILVSEPDKSDEPPARRVVKARDTRRLILKKAREFLATRSYAEFSIEQLHRSCNTNQRTIYSHFTAKSDLYAESRKGLIHELAAEFCSEVPVSMPPFDALHFSVRALYELQTDPRMREIRNSLGKDSASQPWLSPLFDQLVRMPALRSLEAYMLQRSRHRPMTVHAPHQVARHLWMLTEALAVGQVDEARAPRTRREIDEELELIAQAYSTVIPASRDIV